MLLNYIEWPCDFLNCKGKYCECYNQAFLENDPKILRKILVLI